MSWKDDMLEELKSELKPILKEEIKAELLQEIKTTERKRPTMKVREACEELGISRNSFMILVNSGKIPYRKINSQYRFDRKDIESYKKKQTQTKKVKGIA